MAIQAKEIVFVDAKLPRVQWIEPSKDHPHEAYAVYCDGSHAATATISRLEWPQVDRKRVELEMVAYVAAHPEECKEHLAALLRMAAPDAE